MEVMEVNDKKETVDVLVRTNELRNPKATRDNRKLIENMRQALEL
jgi:hypothetical protein